MIDFNSTDICEALRAALPDHSILAPQGSGGQGVVLHARHNTANRQEAIKVLPAGLLTTSDQRRRFEREIRTLASLDHPNIVKLYDCGAAGGLMWFTMEQVAQGVPITGWTLLYQPTTDAVVQRFLQVARALAHAHGRGVIHRDIKPTNILIHDDDDDPDRKGRVCVVDFGLAKLIEACEDGTNGPVSSTQHLGTLQYMSPEQVDGKPLDMRTDLYSLGVVMYEVLSGGQFPYPVNNIGKPGIAQHIRSTEPASLRGCAASNGYTASEPAAQPIDGDLSSIVHKCLEKDRTRRYRSADELCDDLEAWQRCAAVSARSDNHWYKLRKAARHHWRSLATVCVFVILLAIGAVSSTILWQRSEQLAATYRAGLGIYDLVNRGSDARDAGHTTEALALWHEALALDAAAPLRNADIDRMRCEILHRLCEFHLVARDSATARPYCDDAMAVAEQYADHPDVNDTTGWQRRAGFAEILRGRLALADKDHGAALSAFTHAVEIRRELVDRDANSNDHRGRLAMALALSGSAARKLGHMDESLGYYTEAYDIRLALYKADPESTAGSMELLHSEATLAVWHIVQKTIDGNLQATEWLDRAQTHLDQMQETGVCDDRPAECRRFAKDLAKNRGIIERRNP